MMWNLLPTILRSVPLRSPIYTVIDGILRFSSSGSSRTLSSRISGVFRKCCKSPSLVCHYIVSYCVQNQGWLQKPFLNHRSRNPDQNLSFGADRAKSSVNQARHCNHFKPKCQRTLFIWRCLKPMRFYRTSSNIG